MRTIIIARILTVSAAVLMVIWIAIMIAGVDATNAQTIMATPVPVTPDVTAQVIEALVRAIVDILRQILAELIGARG